MTFDEKKRAVDKIHKNKISCKIYNNRDYYVTTIRKPNGKWQTLKYRTEEIMYDKLYQFYYSVQKMDVIPDNNAVIDENLTYSLTEICDTFGLREDHALFLINKNLSKYGKNAIVKENGAYRLSYAGILWLIAQGCQSTGAGDYDAMMSLMSSFYKGSTTDTETMEELTQKYEKLQKDFDSIKSVAESLIETVDALKALIGKECNAYVGKTKLYAKPAPKTASVKKNGNGKKKQAKTVEKKSWSCTKNNPDLPELTDTESAWTDEVRNGIYEAAKRYDTQYATIIKKIYSVMTTKYGVNWDDIVRLVLDACGKKPGTGITKLRTVAYEPELRKIFSEVLADIDTYMS